MALGANDRRILGMVVRQGALQIGVGLTLGLGLALAIAVVAGAGIQSTLFGVGARDPRLRRGRNARHFRLAGGDIRAGASRHACRSDYCPCERSSAGRALVHPKGHALTYVVQAFRPAATHAGRAEALHYISGAAPTQRLSPLVECDPGQALSTRLTMWQSLRLAQGKPVPAY
jgi:hypothetical protein